MHQGFPTTPEEVFELNVRDALRAHRGNVTMCAEQLVVERAPLWEYIRTRPHLYSIITEAREMMADRAESILFKAIDKEKRWSSEFMHDTFGKNRDKLRIPPAPWQEGNKVEQQGKTEPDQGRLTIKELIRLEELKRLELQKPKKPSPNDPDFVQLLDRAGGNVMESIWKNIGNLRAAAKLLGVNRKQLIDYIMLRPDLQAAIQDEREKLNDRSEAILNKGLDDEKPWVVKFVLRTLGRHRGYCLTPVSKYSPVEATPQGVPDHRRLTREELEEMEILQRIARGQIPPKTPPEIQEIIHPTHTVQAPQAQAPQAPGEPSPVRGRVPEAPAAQTPSTESQKPEEPKLAQAPGEPSPVRGRVPEAPAAPTPSAESKKPEEPKPAPTAQPNTASPAQAYRMDAFGNLMSPEDCRLYDQSVFPKGVPRAPDFSNMTPLQKKEFEIIMRRVFGKDRAQRICHPNEPPPRLPEGVPRDEEE